MENSLAIRIFMKKVTLNTLESNKIPQKRSHSINLEAFTHLNN